MTLHEKEKWLERFRQRRTQNDKLLGDLGKITENNAAMPFFIIRHALRLESALLCQTIQELIRGIG